MTYRRYFLAAGLALTPLASALLSACKPKGNWLEGMKPIIWDRDPCAQCGMVISDRRFAAEMAGGKNGDVFKFDDIGCAMTWQRAKAASYPWASEPATRIWVADVSSTGDDADWLDARAAHYTTKTSPMGYDFGASRLDQAGALDFQTMREHVLAKKE
jgi:nitrous oxide reductase accessory protein NosL